MIRALGSSAAIGTFWLVASAHVGSPDAWFEGRAGPYHLTVQVVPAGVVPGVARVYVRAVGDAPTSVTIRADRFDATGGSPPPEPTTAVTDDPGLFAGKLWIMTGGSNSVTVNATGPAGSGSVVIPIVTTPHSRLTLGRATGVALSVMGLFLFAGLVTIIGAAVREGSLDPGVEPSPAKRARARKAMALTALLLAAGLFGGWKWWQSEDASFVRSMYKPLASESSARDGMLAVSIADSAWMHRNDSAWLTRHDASRWTPLVEDHGKLMHAFMISDDMSAFAHLHPATTDSVRFIAALPPLPAGRYRVFADIVHESGFTHTLVSSTTLPAAEERIATATADTDDSWFVGPVAEGATKFTVPDGTTIEWKRGSAPVVAGRPAALSFDVRTADGSPARLEHYMGMPGHAVVQRRDGSVFVHLHPMGTISMASQMAFSMREPGDSIRGRLGKRLSRAEMSMPQGDVGSSVVSFPYAFPKGGSYRVWVQVKKEGKILTAAFDVSVAEQPPQG